MQGNVRRDDPLGQLRRSLFCSNGEVGLEGKAKSWQFVMDEQDVAATSGGLVDDENASPLQATGEA
jgi:hypothetical protein